MSGQALESKINLTCASGVEPRIFRIRLCSGGQLSVFLHHMLCNLCLVCFKAGQILTIFVYDLVSLHYCPVIVGRGVVGGGTKLFLGQTQLQ